MEIIININKYLFINNKFKFIGVIKKIEIWEAYVEATYYFFIPSDIIINKRCMRVKSQR